MFESAELGHRIDKATYDAQIPELRQALLATQFELLESAKFPVIILIGGVDGAGKGETVNLLNEWMDPRHIQTHAMSAPTDDERERPPIWRFWRALPPKGKVGVFFGSWYTDPIVGRSMGRVKGSRFDRTMEEIVRFERMLTDEGALLLKFWFHLSKTDQKKRLETLAQNPKTRWRVTDADWKNFRRYDTFRKVSERALRETSTAAAPWGIVEGVDERYRNLTVGTSILEAMRRKLSEEKPAAPKLAPPLVQPLDGRNVLESLDLSQSLDKKDYGRKLERLSGRLNLSMRDPAFKKRGVVAVFEGVDAAGKGGAIRRVTRALDARHYKVIPIAAPTDEERAQPYLWRFWRHLPRRGHTTIFDRSWYGRVLVERVEGYCEQADWMRAYAEINDFEEQLVRHGFVVAKFWMQIGKDEQLRRFEERQNVAHKQHKITDDDWRNRDKWDVYERAICDMVDRTSTEVAPWTIVEANDKSFARIKVLETLCDKVAAAT